MAIAKLIAPFASISGKVTAPTSSDKTSAVVAMPDTNGRTLVRNFVVPLNPNSLTQIAARGIFSSISEAMQSLTVSQADAWAAIAKNIVRSGRLGLDYKLSWTALFSQVNNYRAQQGDAYVLDPPALDSATTPTGIASVISDDGDPDQQIAITFTDPTPTVGSKFAIRMTRNLGSPVRMARDTDLRYIDVPDACIFPRVTAGPLTYVMTATNVNLLVGDWTGVNVIVISPHGYPSARFFVKNWQITAG